PARDGAGRAGAAAGHPGGGHQPAAQPHLGPPGGPAGGAASAALGAGRGGPAGADDHPPGGCGHPGDHPAPPGSGYPAPERPYASWLGLALVAYGLVGLSALAIRQFRPEVSRETKQLGLVALVFVLVALLARIVSLWSWDGAPFLIPVALGSMLITILIDA